jgi:hypothetical protein
MVRKNVSGKCIRIVERNVAAAPLTIRELTPRILEEEFNCKNSTILEENLFLIIANEKLSSVDGGNRRKGYVAIDRDSGGYPFPSRSVLGATFFNKDALDDFIARNPAYLSSGYAIIELNF